MELVEIEPWTLSCRSTAIERGCTMKTSERVRQLALYASACCMDEVLYDVNDSFMRCPKCERLCRWDFVEQVYSWQDLDDLELKAA